MDSQRVAESDGAEDYPEHDVLEVRIERPKHYRQGKIETIEYIEAQGFNYLIGNAHKYLARYPYKGNPILDLKKAIWHIHRELRRLEAKEAEGGEGR
jgi:hypothetical protein